MSRGRSAGQHAQATPHQTTPTDRPTDRPSRTRHLGRLALAVGTVTAIAVGAGVVTNRDGRPPAPGASRGVSDAGAQVAKQIQAERQRRADVVSRSGERAPAPRPIAPRPVVKRKLWTTAPLDVRLQPRKKTRSAGLLKSTQQVGVTGRRVGGFAEVVYRGQARWVTASYLSRKKIVDPADRPLSNAPCPDGSAIEGAMQDAAVRVYRAACAAFPELSTYGGQAGRGEHSGGGAIDFMTPTPGTGPRLRDFLYANRVALDLSNIIYSREIWSAARTSEGFRGMEDRGSPTQNHEDHVHILVN